MTFSTKILEHINFVLVMKTFLIGVSGDCFNFTSLSTTNGSLLSDYSTTSCLTIPTVTGVTPLLEIELTSNCKNVVENNQIELEILVNGVTTGCQDFDSVFSVVDSGCSHVRSCRINTALGSAPNGTSICNASCDCSTENCKLMLLANPGLKSTGWNVCEIYPISSFPETTTETPAYTIFLTSSCSGGSNLHTITTADLSLCEAWCTAEPGCNGFTYGNGVCLFKQHVCNIFNVNGYTYYKKI